MPHDWGAPKPAALSGDDEYWRCGEVLQLQQLGVRRVRFCQSFIRYLCFMDMSGGKCPLEFSSNLC